MRRNMSNSFIKITPEKMSTNEKYDYIFSKKISGGTRFEWIDHALIGDIQTFEDGIKHNYFPPRQFLPSDSPRGGGNLALPILVCTSLDLLGALCFGSNNATDNVEKFIKKYFLGFYKEFPRLFWDGVRNGMTHKFYPKPFQFKDKTIDFVFFIENPNVKSHIESKGNSITIWLNSFELVRMLRESIQKYKTDLQKSDTLQTNFIRIFQSLENFQTLNKIQEAEVENIVKILTTQNPLYLEDYK